MYSPRELLEVAEALFESDMPYVLEASLRRSISTSYYAAFTAVSFLIADSFTADRNSLAWRRVFRGLNHGAFEKAKRLNSNSEKTSSSARIALVLTTLISLHEKRIAADYDPHLKISHKDAYDAYEDSLEVSAQLEIINEYHPEVRIELASLCLFPNDRQR